MSDSEPPMFVRHRYWRCPRCGMPAVLTLRMLMSPTGDRYFALSVQIQQDAALAALDELVSRYRMEHLAECPMTEPLGDGLIAEAVAEAEDYLAAWTRGDTAR